MAKDNIIFLESFIYISNPLYYAITPKLDEYNKIYLYISNPISDKLHNEFFDINENLKYFDKCFELKDIYFKSKHWWKSFRNLRGSIRKYKKKNITNFLYKINPKAVISCSDFNLYNRIIIKWCKKKKIPFIIIQSGFTYKNETFTKKYGLRYNLKYIIMNKLLGLPKYRRYEIFGYESQSTYLLLWSSYYAINPKRKNLFFIGNPVFDKYFKDFSPQRKIKNNIVICTEFIDIIDGIEAFQQMNNIYREAIKSKPNITFYIKIHPRMETIDKYEKIFDKNRFPNVKIVKDRNLYDLFRKCDIQMSNRSYSSFEAVMMGIPIILVNPNDTLKHLDYFCGEVEIKVTQPEDISNAIDLALIDKYWEEFLEKRKKFCEKRVYSIDGQSSKRSADIIKSIIKKK